MTMHAKVQAILDCAAPASTFNDGHRIRINGHQTRQPHGSELVINGYSPLPHMRDLLSLGVAIGFNENGATYPTDREGAMVAANMLRECATYMTEGVGTLGYLFDVLDKREPHMRELNGLGGLMMLLSTLIADCDMAATNLMDYANSPSSGALA